MATMSAISDFETSFRDRMSGVIPGAVIGFDSTSSDIPKYIKAFGNRSVENPAPLTEDAVFWIASCTKLVTGVAVLQCVEQGKLSLDDPEIVRRLLPEYANPELFVRTGGTGPEFTSPRNGITLRQLVTHSAGMGYPMFHPLSGDPQGGTSGDLQSYKLPLLYEPGTRWTYSPGLDWAGEMVARANNSTLGEYMEKHIFKPLGMNSSTFELDQRPDLKSRLMPAATRSDGKLMTAEDQLQITPPHSPKDQCGGNGLYSTVSDYMKILSSILHNDEKLLKKSSVEEMFKPSLGNSATESINSMFTGDRELNRLFTWGMPMDANYNYGISGTLIETDVEGSVRGGTLTWTGLPNLAWYIDRKAGICTFFATQMVPPAEEKCVELHKQTQRDIYGVLQQKW